MGRARGHLRLVQPGETVEQVEASLPPVASRPGSVVDTGLRFTCPTCGKVQDTNRPVIERWCTGDPLNAGIRRHQPVRMTREEI